MNKEKVILKVLELYKNSTDLSDRNIRKNYRFLRASGVRHFGNWSNTLKKAGLDPNLFMLRRKWTKEELTQAVRYFDCLTAKFVKANHLNIYKASIKHFGTWKRAVEEITKHDYNNIRLFKSWDKDKVLKEIRQLNKDQLSYIHTPNVLYKASLRYFGSWENAIEVAGFCYQDIKKVVSWSRDKIISFVKNKKKGLSITKMNFDGYGNVVAAGTRYFGTWQKTIEAAGLDYSTIKKSTLGHRCVGNDGIIYDSFIEREVANILLKHLGNKINNYTPHKKVCCDRKWTCDFYIEYNNTNMWIEVDGLQNFRPQKEGFKQKLQHYKDNKLNYKIVFNVDDIYEILKEL